MRISFDFDGTLTVPTKVKSRTWIDGTPYWQFTNTPNADVHALVRRLDADGHDVILVTARCEWEDVEPFVTKHSLPFQSIHYTCGELKLDTLIDLAVDIHFDDSLREHGANVWNDLRMVYVPHPREVELGNDPAEWERFSPEWTIANAS